MVVHLVANQSTRVRFPLPAPQFFVLLQGKTMELNASHSFHQILPWLAFSKPADQWLESMRGQTIEAKLESRRITKVCVEEMISTAAIGIGKDNNLTVYFNYYGTSLQDCIESLGHEIGHTFHYDLSKTPPIKITDDDRDEKLLYIIEDFCNLFSLKWIMVNDKKEIERCCKKAGVRFHNNS